MSDKEKMRRDRIMLRTVCTFRMAFYFASLLNFEFNRAKNLNRTWAELGLVEFDGEFRENWQGIQMPFIQVISREVYLK